jgi:Ca-activated chloride channel homolog
MPYATQNGTSGANTLAAAPTRSAHKATSARPARKTLSRLLLALLVALQLVPVSYAQPPQAPASPASKASNTGNVQVNTTQAATHYIASADPRCPRNVALDDDGQPQNLLKGKWRKGFSTMPAPAVAIAPPATLTAPPPPSSPLAMQMPLVESTSSAAAPRSAPVAQGNLDKSRRKEPLVREVRIAGKPNALAPAQLLTDADSAATTVTTKQYDVNPVKRVASEPVSTFSIDVDTGAYTSVRGLLRSGQALPAGAVRVEEMLNYFDYAYTRPEQQGSNAPFAVNTEMAPSPWNANNQLLRIGIQARDAAKDSLPPANLVFLIDVSGSMSGERSLPMVQDAMLGLVQQLRPQDKVSLVTYASGTQVALPPTSGSDKVKLADAICGLQASGSTAGASGIKLAYEQAKAGFVKDGINRILLATDGDFNVGVSDTNQLKTMVAAQRKNGISLSTLGVGYASYNDHLMEQVADAGDGKYSFLDNLQEGRKVLVNEFTSTLQTVAQDVKLQLEFNPAIVKEYRLIGYENRQLAREDFTNDAVDAGDIGAGHRVTALYELTMVGKPGLINEERYPANRPAAGTTVAATPTHNMIAGELAFMKIRYKTPSDNPTAAKSQEFGQAITLVAAPSIAKASTDFQFATAVAAAGQIMSRSKYVGAFTLADSLQLAKASLGADKFGQRKEFMELVQLAQKSERGENVGQVAHYR